MPKRRVSAVGSDDEGPSSAAQAFKRQRVAESDSEGADAPEPTPRDNRRGKGNSKKRSAGEEDDDVEQEEPDEDEEKRFEEENEDEIRAKLMSKSSAEPGIAEMGIIEKLEMHQFMCHKYLTFTFGPQINFIIGHNGSGKSAVLSALTVALGGKAMVTGRGSGLKSFIREGQCASEVTVTLKNHGEEAYKPQDYGDSIVITRRFTKEGSSSYKIKSKDGRVISTKKEELSAICDHMNIQVDNPMNILTQDSARQFLSASAPADKYKFFLRGTQLSQLSEEYSTCMANVTQTTKVLQAKSEALPDLEDALREAMDRFQEAAKAREQKHKADELKKELAWAHVASKEDEMRKKLEEVAKLQRRLPKIQQDLAQAEKSVEDITQNVVQRESAVQEVDDIEDLRKRKKDIAEKLRANKHQLNELRREEVTINEDVEERNREIESARQNLEQEQNKALTQIKREELRRKLNDAQDQVKRTEEQLQSIRDQRKTFEAEANETKTKGEAMEEDLKELKKRITNCQQQLEHCEEVEKNKFAPFGNRIDEVLAEIARTRWLGEKPIGPFGIFVKVKEPQLWAPLMRVQLGSMMRSFAITDARDRKQLDQILRRHGNSSNNIVISGREMFDYSKGELPSGYMTALRALEFTDPYVSRILINSNHIESTLLAKTRAEADQLLRQLGRGGVGWTADYFRVQRFPEGGGQSQLLQRVTDGDMRQHMFTNNDKAAAKQQWLDDLKRAEAEHQVKVTEIRELRQKYDGRMRQVHSLQAQEREMEKMIRDTKSLRDRLQQELNEELSVTVQVMQGSLETMEAAKALAVKQFTELQLQKAKLQEAQHPLMQEQEKVKKEIDEFEERRSALNKLLENAALELLAAQNNQKHWKDKLEAERNQLAAMEEQATQLQDEFTAWTAKAEEYCERFPNPREADEVKRNLEAVQRALKEREKRHGASVEEMTIEVNKRKAAVDNVKKDLRTMVALNKALKKSIKIRLQRWHEFRRHIALRCKIYFSYHLSNRGYFGKVLFDHVNGTLQLKVQTDDQAGTQNTREKDPRSLSGGEKSFSTICLLLSLWESIGCPIRCLDEFDVFMDAVNRRISMRMMIDTANASDNKQYVLITPQDMTNVQIGHTVRVHRMTDPERGQAVLAFN